MASGVRDTHTYLLPALCVILVIALGYFGFQTWTLTHGTQSLSDTLAEKEVEINTLHEEMTMLTEALESTRAERDTLSETLEEEQEKNSAFAEQIEDISGTVGRLDKLSKTDPELLKKYSKVYFLNEHYTPQKLIELPRELSYDETKDFYLDAQVMPFFEDMLEDAKDDGVDLWVVSAYRSFDTQSALKGRYTVTYGSGANAFSADQGYSEHQLGTTVDFTTTGLSGGLDGFETTPAYAWLKENAHRYGFVLSYPPGNTYYIFEPWHWRFVGRDLARDLHRDEKYFYDLDQREIDEYLISLFD